MAWRHWPRRLGMLVIGCLAITTLLIYLPTPQDGAPGYPPKYGAQAFYNQPRDTRPARMFGDQDDAPLPWPQRDTGAHDNLKDIFSKYEFVRDPTPNPTLVERLSKALAKHDSAHPTDKECPYNETLNDYYKRTKGHGVVGASASNNWDRFYQHISSCDLYRDESLIDDLLHDIATLPIKYVEQMEGGTQIKLILTFANDKSALMKPMRFGRDYETDPNHFYFGDFERHTAEIASYHLDKVLGFRRAVPTVGRVVNISSDLWAKAEKRLAKTFFISPAKNLCFVGKCDYYCDTTHAICGMPDLKEGSLQVFLPDEDLAPRKHFRSLYRRTYSKRDQVAVWQKDQSYCSWRVKQKPIYAHGRRLLDLVDLHILDFFMVNQDRHHFEQFTVFDDRDVYPLHFDNGRGFGKTAFDFDDILSPLTQCCVIRASTLRTLLRFYADDSAPMLTEALHKSLSKDPISPILPPKHYIAIERRLGKVMSAIDDCLKKAANVNDVIRVEYENPNVPLPKKTTEDDDDDEEDDE